MDTSSRHFVFELLIFSLIVGAPNEGALFLPLGGFFCVRTFKTVFYLIGRSFTKVAPYLPKGISKWPTPLIEPNIGLFI